MNQISLGILQGRLSPSHDGRFQFFPNDWTVEFPIAKEIGFDAIEWLFDWPDFENNPIITQEGRNAILEIVKKSGVKVSSMCADYYMKYTFLGGEADASIAMLQKLIDAAPITSEQLILIPLLEQNAPKTESEKEEIINSISKVLEKVKKKGVRIAFEHEMTALESLAFINKFNSDQVGVYYDIGNAISYGFDGAEDIRALGKHVFGVHAKDRKVNTAQSVILGKGDADYPACIDALSEIGFSGKIIMQAWRGEDYLKDAKEQYLFLKKLTI